MFTTSTPRSAPPASGPAGRTGAHPAAIPRTPRATPVPPPPPARGSPGLGPRGPHRRAPGGHPQDDQGQLLPSVHRRLSVSFGRFNPRSATPGTAGPRPPPVGPPFRVVDPPRDPPRTGQPAAAPPQRRMKWNRTSRGTDRPSVVRAKTPRIMASDRGNHPLPPPATAPRY